MSLTKKRLRELILEEINLLVEEEGDEEEATDEEATDEEATGEEDEPEADIDVSPEEEASLSKSADDQILAYIIDFETNAIKSADVANDNELRLDPGASTELDQVTIESKWYKKRLSNMLFEEDDERLAGQKVAWVGSPLIDIAVFSADVSRLVMNYDSLIDMEALIINKASNYLIDRYDKETADYFIELMDAEYDMRSGDIPSIDKQNEDPQSPPAVGSGLASQPGGGA